MIRPTSQKGSPSLVQITKTPSISQTIPKRKRKQMSHQAIQHSTLSRATDPFHQAETRLERVLQTRGENAA